jgi:hypothetical protein
MRRTAWIRKPAREARELTRSRREVLLRSGGWCEVRLDECLGQAHGVHHRKPRGHGDHRVVNLIAVCARCHSEIHGHPAWARSEGLLVRSADDPALVPVVIRQPLL